MLFFFWGLVFAFGASMGSFLNVIIDRLPRGEDILRTRSHCENCRSVLTWYELIPLVSFLVQRARCRKCGVKLSWQYFGMEVLTGLITLLSVFFWQLPYSGDLIIPSEIIAKVTMLVFIYLLIVIAVIDLKSMIIPDQLILSLIVIWSLMTLIRFILAWSSGNELHATLGPMLEHVVTGTGLAIFFYLLIMITRGRGMGGGDLKLSFVIGLFLPMWEAVAAIYLAFLLGGLVALGLLLSRKKKFGAKIPFGPFLVAGAIFSAWWGPKMIEFYLTTFT